MDGGTPESHFQELALRHMGEDPIAYAKFHTIGTLPYFLAGSYRHFFVSILGDYKKRAGLPYPSHENIAHKMTAVLYSGTFAEKWNAVKSLSFVLVEILWRVLLLVFGLSAFFVKGMRNKYLVLVLWMLVLYFAFLTGPASLTRYRIVSDPLLLSLAGIGAWMLIGYLKNIIARRNSSRILEHE